MTLSRLRVALWLVLALSACGDDDAMPMPTPDSGTDAAIVRVDSGAPPMCRAATCGSPLVGDHCCTRAQDVAAGVAMFADRCGADLGSVVSALAGDCVELRQAGELDRRCPPRRVAGLLESGCCMPEGVCGTLNQAVDLGCQRVLAGGGPLVACNPSSIDAGDEPDAN